MSTVFLGGSIRLARLNEAIKERIDKIVTDGLTVLVGDADGADKSIQKHLADRHYENVVVFCTGSSCRNNIGRWETTHVESHREQRDFRYYSVKDKRMSEEATHGFMLWDGKSKGTLNNIVNLLEQGKSVLVYFSPSNSFHGLADFRDLDSLLANCDSETLERLERQLHLKERAKPKQRQLTFA